MLPIHSHHDPPSPLCWSGFVCVAPFAAQATFLQPAYGQPAVGARCTQWNVRRERGLYSACLRVKWRFLYMCVCVLVGSCLTESVLCKKSIQYVVVAKLPPCSFVFLSPLAWWIDRLIDCIPNVLCSFCYCTIKLVFRKHALRSV